MSAGQQLPRWSRIGVVVVCTLLAAAVAAWRLPLTYDLTWFLPAPDAPGERVLVERVGQGPGAQLLFVQAPEATPAAMAALADRLRQLPGVERVLPDSALLDVESLPAVLRERYPLLADLPDTVEAWQETLADRAADLAAAFDAALIDLLAIDPALVLADLGGRLAAATPGDAIPLRTLLLTTSVPAFDLGAQQELIAAIRRSAGGQPVELFGAGAYGVALDATVRFESILFSTLASLALLALVIWRFRSFRRVIATAVPLAAGGAAGALLLSLVFDQVHGITLAFGFTLLGVAIDMPLHLLSHRRTAAVWPTLRIGVLSTLAAYLSFLSSGTEGIAQLGVFAAGGLCGAGLACLALFAGGEDLPAETAAADTATRTGQPGPTRRRPQLAHGPWLLALAMAVSGVVAGGRLNADLGALTPVPEAWRVVEGQLRGAFETLEQRYLVAVSGADLEQTLERTAAVAEWLEQRLATGQLEGVQPVTLLLPPQSVQERRQAQLQRGDLLAAFNSALVESPFAAESFAPFVAVVERQAAAAGLLSYDALRSDPTLGALVSAQLYPVPEGFRSLIFLRGLNAPAAVAQQVNAELGAAGAIWVDLKAASIGLVQRYQQRFLWLLCAIPLLLVLLLLLLTRSLGRTFWIVGTQSAAVTGAAVLSLLLHGPLALFELIALMLVAGLGLDYALFYSRSTDSTEEQRETGSSVALCVTSSLLVFGILACSSIPLLRGLGLTVSLGVLLAYGLTRIGVRLPAPAPAARR